MTEPIHLDKLIRSRVARLQAEYLSSKRASASALLASLRQGLGREPGAVPSIWEITLSGLGQARGDMPTKAEQASHDTLTLYALHQQSKSEPMHVAGQNLCRAVARLASRSNGDHEKAVRRRFDAAATAATYGELRQHMRGLIQQLRNEGIPIDYGQLAQDLMEAQWPGGLAKVRRRWVRSYYSSESPVRVDDDSGFSTEPKQTTNPPGEE